ncbi:MAG: M48 family metalloprotease [Sphingobium sp.]|nr:M48 family metalloprotease [Sphingobium sp.]
MAGGVALLAPQGNAASTKPVQTVSAMSAAEKAEGAKAHPELLKEFGGLYAGPQAAYVVQVGRKIAVQSSLSNQQGDFTISLLNSSVNNAFAIPGGYVYVTRQLMGLMNDEAELAGVLGHEIGHVAAQHGKKRQSAATRNTILGVLGQVLIGQVAGDSGLGGLLQKGIGTGAQLLTLKYSRTQEYEADDLGVQYLAKAGYDPAALSTMLASLAAQTALDGQVSGTPSSIPEWASTHPDPGARVSRALQSAQSTGSKATLRNKALFISNLEGLLYGDDAAQGIVMDRQFMHPGLKLKFTVPEGYAVDNQPDFVTISGQSAKAQFGGGRYDGNLDAYVQGLFQQLAGQGGQIGAIPLQRTTINGLAASYGSASMTNSQGSRLTVTIIGYAYSPSTAYQLMVVTPQGQSMSDLVTTVNSMARMTDQEAAGVKSRKIHLVRVRAGDTPASLSQQMAYGDHQLERFLVLNGLRSGDTLTPGTTVKLVVF